MWAASSGSGISREVQGLHLRRLVCQEGVLRCLLAFTSGLKLCQVTVVVALHLEVEDFGLAGRGSGDEVVIQQLQDAAANLLQLFLHLQPAIESVEGGTRAGQTIPLPPYKFY